MRRLLAVTIISQTKCSCTAARVLNKKKEILSTVLNSKLLSLNLSLIEMGEMPDSNARIAALPTPSTRATR